MPSVKTSQQAACNLPIAISESFSGDDIALILGTCLPDAVFFLEEESRSIVGANLKFLSLVDVALEVLEAQDVTVDRLIAPGDRAVFDALYRSALQGEESSFEVSLAKSDGSSVLVTMQLRPLRWKRRSYVIGFVRDVSAMERRVEQLKGQLESQKERAFEAIKSSLRQYQFNEKIKRTPHMAKSLLNLESEEKLFTEAARMLTSEEGLGYQEATFLLLEENVLRVAYSTRPNAAGAVYPLKEENRFSQFVHNGFEQGDAEASCMIPLQSRGQFIGIFEVTSHSKEKVFFDESNRVQQWHKDVLYDIGGIVALLIDNLRLNREVKRQAIVDSLTQTYNRHYFVTRLASEVRRAKRYSRPVSLIFIDVDKFKEINDQHGHLQGDDVLRELGAVFSLSLRDVDVICRYGGDEFIILLPETDLDMGRQTAEKLLAAVQEHDFRSLDNPKVTVPVTVSIGVSTLDPSQNEDQFLQKADEALYFAKREGRNRVGTNAQRATEILDPIAASSCEPLPSTEPRSESVEDE